MQTQPYLVLRPFSGDRRYDSGETIDVADWPPRRALLLTEQRYIAPVMPAPPGPPPPMSRRQKGGTDA